MNFENSQPSAQDYEKVEYLKHELLRLEAQIAYQQNLISRLSGGNLLKTEQIDLYPGEQHDLVLSVLSQSRERCPEGSRARDILDSILENNVKVGVGEEILTKVKRILGQGIPSKSSAIADLQKVGFRYVQNKKHPKLVFFDRYTYVIPGTPSDSRRANKNCYSELSKCIASSFKL